MPNKENNHHIKDCPFLVPEENMKIFTEFQKNCVKDPYSTTTYNNVYKNK